MNMHFSSIWIEAGKPRQKKILLCYVYREWKYLFQQDKTSKTIDCQLDRWISLIGQWENALRSGKEICVQGDMNLNFLTWMKQNSTQTSHSRNYSLSLWYFLTK